MLNLVVLKIFGIFAILFFDIAAGDSHEFLSDFLSSSSDEGDNYSGKDLSPYLNEKPSQIPHGGHGGPNYYQLNGGQFVSRPNRGRGPPNRGRGRPNLARDQLNGGQFGDRPNGRRGRPNGGQFARPNGGGGRPNGGQFGRPNYRPPQKAEAKTPAWYNPPRSPYGHYCIGLNRHIKDGDIIFQHYQLIFF